MKRNTRKTASSGFTLVEMLITVAIVTIMATIGVPGIRDFFDKEELLGATEQLYSQIASELGLGLQSTYRPIVGMVEILADSEIMAATGLDAIAQLPLLDRAQLERQLGYPIGEAHVLVTYHPVTLYDETPRAALQGLLDALDALPDSVLTITAANADAGGGAINTHLEAFAAQRRHVHFTPSLGQLRYLSLAQASAVVVGNSSSGLIEAPALGVPTVNIGERQRNRLRAPSVIDCANTQAAIGAALSRITPVVVSSVPPMMPSRRSVRSRCRTPTVSAPSSIVTDGVCLQAAAM